MFIIEFIAKNLFKKKEAPIYDPLQEAGIEDYESCEHTFMPIDSTGETLSCTKCGTLAKKSELEEKSYFKNNFFMK